MRSSMTEYFHRNPGQELDHLGGKNSDVFVNEVRRPSTLGLLNGRSGSDVLQGRKQSVVSFAMPSEAASELTDLQQDLRQWFQRTSSAQEVELLKEGVISERPSPLRLPSCGDVRRVFADDVYV